jgi:hypothetical protein
MMAEDPDATSGTSGSEDGGAGSGTEKDWKAEAEKWKKLSRQNEDAAKEFRAKASKLDEIEAASKSEAEKLQERASKAEGRATEAEMKALRLEVAGEKGLSPVQAKRLIGGTREELEADADELLASFRSEERSQGSPSTRPRERLRGGGDPTVEPEERDPRKLAAKVPRR